MSCEGETVELLRAAGYRVTPQRMLILSTLRHATGHQTAQELFDIVRERYPFVDVSTVYRTLTTLRKLRLVAETDLGQGDLLYEWIGGARRHHHLVCRGCSQMQEIEDASLEVLAQLLGERYGFRADLDHFAIPGLCAVCAAREARLSRAEE